MGKTNRRLSSLVWTQRPSQENTHPRSACTPSMKGERTPEHTMTGASCTRVAGMSFVLSSWRRHGKRRWMTGPKDRKPSYPSGSVKDQERKPESPSLLMMKMRDQLKLLQVQRKKKRRRKKKRKRRNRSMKLKSVKYNTFQPAPFSHKTKIPPKLLPCDTSKQFCLNSSKFLNHEL